MGRKAYKPDKEDRRKVKAMAQHGLRDIQIADVLAISRATVQKYFNAELKQGRAEGDALLAQTVFQEAIQSKNTALLCFLSKVRLHWRETSQIQHEIKGFPKIIYAEYGSPGCPPLPDESSPADREETDNDE